MRLHDRLQLLDGCSGSRDGLLDRLSDLLGLPHPRTGAGDDSNVGLVVLVRDAGAATLRLVADASTRSQYLLAVAASILQPEEAFALMRAGASDVIPFDDGGVAEAIENRVRRRQTIEDRVSSDLVSSQLIGASEMWRSTLHEAVEIALFSDAPTLLTGETGTGKELLARLIHTLDSRRHKDDLIVVDCTTIVPTLSGSEFFGHEKGAFTGATAARDGAFALADDGTLFLDEIGELGQDLQAELLRVLQEGTYKRVGGNQWRSTNFRLVCATHRNLDEMIAEGRFRSDLFHRLAANRVHIPALNARPPDILPLARHLLAEQLGGPPPQLDRAVEQLLVARKYPGNVRELRQLMARVAMRYCGSGPITLGLLPPDEIDAYLERGGDQPSTGDGDQTDLIDEVLERGLSLQEIKDVLRDAVIEREYRRQETRGRRGAVGRTAEALGTTPRTVQTWKSRHRAGTELAVDPADRGDQEA